jgi:hypothetical protein
MLNVIRVLLTLTRMTAADLLARANAVFAGLNLNPAYPNPPIPLPDFRTAIDDFSAAMTAALDGGAKAIAHRNAVGEKLRVMLRRLAQYVEGNCNGDMTTFLSSGFQAVSNARTRPHSVSEAIRTIAPGAGSGEFLVGLVKVPGAVSYELRWAPTASGGTPGEWSSQPVVKLRPPTLVKGLTPGVSYVFQARALTRSGLTNWSESVTRICT